VGTPVEMVEIKVVDVDDQEVAGPTCRGDLMIRLEKDGCGISAAVLLQGVPYGDRAMV
jgi:hypothetical protein